MDFSLPTTGAILLMLGLIALALKPQYVQWMAVFFIPFSATAIVNVHGINGRASAVTAPLYFAALATGYWVIRRSFEFPRGWWEDRYTRLVAAFMLIVICSWVMSYNLAGTMRVCSIGLQDTQCESLHFGWRNVTQTMYLGIWIAFSVGVMKLASEEGGLRIITSAITCSVGFVTAWGLLQWTAHYFHYSYPNQIFNTSDSPFALGYLGQFAGAHVKRVASVAVEPSILAEYLLCTVPLLAVQAIHAGTFCRKASYAAVLFAGYLALVSTATTTAIVGTVLLIVGLCAAFLLRVLTARAARLQVVTITLAMLVYWLIQPNVGALWEVLVSDKIATIAHLLQHFSGSKDAVLSTLHSGGLSSYSTAERFFAFRQAINGFTQSPILGVGWRSMTSPDTALTLLANTGILGLVGFGALLFYVILRGIKFIRSLGTGLGCEQARDWHTHTVIVLLVILVINQIGGFSFPFGHLWIVLALVASAGLRSPGSHGKESRVAGGEHVN